MDYYETLGVARDATADEIKKAFRRKARELHPDVNKAEDAEERFKQCNEAYDVLSDPDKRAQYDRFGTVGRQGAGGPGYVDLGDLFGGAGGFDMGDLFSAFFGGVSGAGRGVRLEGRNMATGIVVTLREAATGVDKDLTVDRLAPCDVCGGSGSAEGGAVTTCPDCNGSGQRLTVRQTFLGSMQTAVPCDRCGATGHIIDNPCEECQGSGRVPDRQHVTVHVPAGIGDGQQVCLRGLGEAGIRGARAGDLIVTVRVARDEYLHREGDDLHCQATVSVAQAALGTETPGPGLLEDNVIEIPAGTQHGDTIRIKGKGMPRWNRNDRGDLYVHIAVEVPKKLTKRQRELFEELAAELGEHVSEPKSPVNRLKDWLRG